jgi:hypothetical protein
VNNVKKTNLMKGVFAVLLLASLTAGAETQYPAADFQPKVLYKDPDYKATESASSTASKTAAAPVEQAKPKAKVVDPNYPAADYQPKVLYKDESYKPSQAPSAAASVATESNEVSVVESEKPAASKKEESNLTSLIGLVVLALGAFFFFNKKGSKAKAQGRPSDSSVYANVTGTTGVEKYLASLPQASKATGVEKYLENQAKQQPISGVAKYVAKQIIRDREAAAAKVTGVEKYLRSKG